MSELRLSIVVPLFNEFTVLPQLVKQLDGLNAEQLIIVDGESDDGSFEWLEQNWCRSNSTQPLLQDRILIKDSRGRSSQMNAGAAAVVGDVVVFLHADTILPEMAKQEILEAIKNTYLWGRFDLNFGGDATRSLKIIAWFINLRSRLTGIATGDQAIFIEMNLFRHLNGFAKIPLMEDIEMSKRLKQHCKPFCCSLQAKTSARRWKKNGVFITVMLMWLLRFGYFLGISPARLAKVYRSVR